MDTISVSVFGVDDDAKMLDTYQEAGVTRCILRLPSERSDTILPRLNQYAKLLN